MFMLTRLPDQGSYVSDILPAFIVSGLGTGMVFLPMINAAVSGASHDDAGLASALLNTFQQLGGAVGLALLSTIATLLTTSVLVSNPHAGSAHALVAGFTRGFAVAAAFGVTAAIVAVLTISRDVGRTDRIRDTAEETTAVERVLSA
jgi:hypothetical protein